MKPKTDEAVGDYYDEALGEYYQEAQSWSEDLDETRAKSRKLAWIVAGVATLVALMEAVALVALTPLKTVVPYTLLVDKQTGFVQALEPLEGQSIRPDEALERSMLAQYVIARESFDIDTLKDSYRKVALWSTGDARSRYLSEMQATNPLSPLASLPRRAVVGVEIRSISPLNEETAFVRYVTTRTDPGGQILTSEPWIAVVKYRFSGAAMSAENRLINPLGFQVVSYRRNAELAREMEPVAVPSSATMVRPTARRLPSSEETEISTGEAQEEVP